MVYRELPSSVNILNPDTNYISGTASGASDPLNVRDGNPDTYSQLPSYGDSIPPLGVVESACRWQVLSHPTGQGAVIGVELLWELFHKNYVPPDGDFVLHWQKTAGVDFHTLTIPGNVGISKQAIRYMLPSHLRVPFSTQVALTIHAKPSTDPNPYVRIYEMNFLLASRGRTVVVSG